MRLVIFLFEARSGGTCHLLGILVVAVVIPLRLPRNLPVHVICRPCDGVGRRSAEWTVNGVDEEEESEAIG